VNARLPLWQQRLNLQDWKISIIMSHPADLKPKTLGNIHWDADKKSAVIRVLDASDYRLPYREMLEDMEFTVVHELIHLELSSLPRSEASRRDEEHAVNTIADALLKLDRKK
jgi:1-acyl-sn-glycerol-3-phosphate acyltransferase